jgi:EmrB/QacA subfamily drug resistance transporter
MTHRDDATGLRRWLALATLCSAFFMVILDVAVVNVALPTIQVDLGVAEGSLQWVMSAYALAFGGLLLLGGRAADLLGRRRVFIVGVATFSGASLLAGLAWSAEILVAARALQGVGAAAMTPAALSILTTTFPEGRDRNVALGVWSAVGAAGGSAGVLLGGLLTGLAGWEWMFFLNLPVGVTVIAAAPVLLREGRGDHAGRGFDLAGAATATAAVSLLVYALVGAADAGWASIRTATLLAASAGLLALFVAVERRARTPLVPFALFRLPALTGSNVAALFQSASVYGMIFVLTLYMQRVLGYSPIEAGLAWLAFTLAALASSLVISRVATRTGARVTLLGGLVLLAAGLALLARVRADGSYAADLLPGMLLCGLGNRASHVSLAIGALAGVEKRDAGLASGLVSVSQQVGAALGVAVLSTIALAHVGPRTDTVELAAGFRTALLAATGFVALGLLAAFVLIGRPGGRRRAAGGLRRHARRTVAAAPRSP